MSEKFSHYLSRKGVSGNMIKFGSKTIYLANFLLIISLFTVASLNHTTNSNLLSTTRENSSEKPVHLSGLFNHQIEAALNTHVITKSIQDEGTGSIEVCVYAATSSKPISNAGVIVYDIKVGANISLGTTDKDGIFRAFGLGKGYYNITVIETGFIQQTKTGLLRFDGDHLSVPFYLEKGIPNSGFIEVNVTDKSTGKPLTGAVVSLYKDTDNDPLQKIITDSTGWFNFTNLYKGTYNIKVRKSDYYSLEKIITIDFVGDGDIILFNLIPIVKLEGGIEVTVYDLSGQPLENVMISTYNSSEDSINEGYTDSKGFYNITSLPTGNFNITVSIFGYEEVWQQTLIDYPTDRDFLKFHLSSLNLKIPFDVYVFNDIGEPIEGSLVKVTTNKLRTVVFDTTNNKGFVEINNLVVGWIYTFNVTAENYASSEKSIFVKNLVNSRINFYLVPVNLSPSFLQISVKGDMNEILVGAYIEIFDTNKKLVFTGLTDSSGNLDISTLGYGEFTVRVSSQGYMTQETIGFSNFAGDSDQIAVILPNTQIANTGSITIKVVDTSINPLENVYLSVQDHESGNIVWSAYTGLLGEINVTNLFVGQYDIFASKYGYYDREHSTIIDYEGDHDEVWFALTAIDTCTIDLYLYDSATDEPLWGFYQISVNGGNWTDWYDVDDSGHGIITDLPIGEYSIQAYGIGYYFLTHITTLTYLGENSIVTFPLIAYYGDGVQDKYALIVGGAVEPRFSRDARNFFYTLVDHYEFNPSDVFLLTPRDSIDGNIVPRDRPTTRVNVIWAIEQIAMLSDGDDLVVVFWTGHGSYNNFETRINSIDSDQLDSSLDTIRCGKMFLFLGPCLSGSVIDELQESNRAIYTSCASDESGYASDTHSLWPDAIYRAFDPDKNTEAADSDDNNKVSLDEAFTYAYDYITDEVSDQHPQAWIGSLINPTQNYLGSDPYTMSMDDKFIAKNSLVLSEASNGEMILKDSSTLDISVSVGMYDQELDLDDIVYQITNMSDPQYPPIVGVNISIYYLNGSLLVSQLSDIDGIAYFYDLKDGTYSWEAVHNGIELSSGLIATDGLSISVLPFPNNWDYQGDDGDIRFIAEEESTFTPVESVIISLYFLNGSWIGNSSTNIQGTGYFHDLPDGLYGYEAFYETRLVDEGDVVIDSTVFTIETDIIPPIVAIVYPLNNTEIIRSATGYILNYSVIEENYHTVSIFLDGELLVSEINESFFETLPLGNYILSIQVVDVAGNVGNDEIHFSIVEQPTTTTSSTVITFTDSSTSIDTGKTNSTPGYLHMITLIMMFSLILLRKKRK
ncbi:MAG: carboxypeptidase regulatory-like domain-containing protein [Candidatus Hodarchaeales archaeon]